MTARDRGLPSVPDGLDTQLRDFLTGVRRLLVDVQAGRLATATTTTAPTTTDPGTPGPPGPSGPPGPPAPGVEPDLTPPPTPDNLAAVGAFSHVIVTWDAPVYEQGRGNKQTLIYGKKWPTGDPAPTFSEDALQGTVSGGGAIYALPSDPNTRWAIWAKFETNDGVLSVSPAGGANGVVATTGQDVTSLLEVLTGQITESQLFSSLGSRIDLIDGNGAGSVNARIAVVQAQANSDIGLTLWKYWGFDASLESWAAANATATRLGSIVTWTPTTSDPSFSLTLATADRFQGATYYGVRARVRRVSGTGAWEGRLQYSTAGHGFSTSFTKTIAVPSNPADWNVLEWDMRSLTAGGTDWTDTEIRGLRIDLVSDAASSWEIDWVAVGTPSTTPLSAAIAQESVVRASETGALSAQYTVKVDVNGYVSGFGLASSANNSVPVSSFIVRADSFAVASPSGPGITPAVPFIVRTTPTTENGVSIPAGVYIDAAYVVNLQARYATIAELVADDITAADISVSQLTAGTLQVSEWMQSAGYVAGSSGWRIAGDGSAEFGFANIRGLLLASQIGANSITAGKIDTRGLDIKDGSGNVVFSAGTPLTAAYLAVQIGGGNLLPNSSFELDSDGDLVPDYYTGRIINNATFTVEVVSTVASVDGAQHLRINVTSVAGATSINHLAVQDLAAATPVIGGTPYTFSASVRTSTTAYKALLQIDWLDASDVSIQVDTAVAFVFPATGAWYRTGGTLNAPANAAKARVRFGVQRPSTGDTTLGFIRFDAIQLERGDVMTAYAVSALDKVGIDNPISAGNIALYMASAAIGNAYIADLSADKLTAGSIRGRNVQAGAFMTKGTFLTVAPAAGAATVQVDNTADFPASGSAWIIDTTNDRDLFTYTGKTASTFTGCSGVLGSHTAGASVVPRAKGMLIDRITNEQRFFGDRGDGTVEELASIGLIDGADPTVAQFGSVNLSNRSALVAVSAASVPTMLVTNSVGRALDASAVGTSDAISGVNLSGSGAGVFGQSGSGPGIEGTSSSGNAASFTGNATRGPLALGPVYTTKPTNNAVGQLAFITNPNNGGTYLCQSTGTTWVRVRDGVAWNANDSPSGGE